LQRNGSVDCQGRGPTQRALAAERAKREASDVQKAAQCRCPNVSRFLPFLREMRSIAASYVDGQEATASNCDLNELKTCVLHCV